MTAIDHFFNLPIPLRLLGKFLLKLNNGQVDPYDNDREYSQGHDSFPSWTGP